MKIEIATNVRRYNKSWPDIPKSVNAWTEASPKTPLRVRKEEYRTKIKVRNVRNKRDFITPPRRCSTIIRCPAPTRVSHGTKDAFSTGSQAQNPPKLKAS